MKRFLAILLSLMLLMSALMVPINISAEGIDWSAELEDRYDFDFTNEFYFSGDQHTDSQISNDNCYYDISKPWVYGSTTIDAGFNRGNRIIYPAYSAVEKSNNWGPQSFFQPGSVTYNDETVTTLQVTSLNPSFFMPLKEDGTPFELAPEHTYTVKIAYQVTATASSNNGGKLYFCAGIPSNGDMNSTNLCYTSTQSGNEIASWMAGNNYTYTATKEISTIGMSSDSNYNSNDNTYVKNYNGTDYTLYNYLYFIIPDYVKPTLDIISLEIIRDDYTPDWGEAFENKYIFDFTNEDYYADNISSVLDQSKPWKLDVSFDAGYDRGLKSLPPVHTAFSEHGWGAQAWSQPGTAVVDSETVNTLHVHTNHNNYNAYFVPLKEDGKPFEFAPGFKYTIKTKMYVESIGQDTTPLMEYCVGLSTVAGLPIDYSNFFNNIKFAGLRVAYLAENVGNVIEIEKTIDLSNLTSDPNYDVMTNTYKLTYNGTEYLLDNYFYFAFTRGITDVHFISLEIYRDDYVATGTVEYYDGVEKVHSEEVNIGSFTPTYTLDDTADKMFIGWYSDSALTNPVSSVNVSEGAVTKLYAKWEKKANWDNDLEKKYAFNFDNVGYYTDRQDHGSYDRLDDSLTYTTVPVTIDSGYGRGTRYIYPTFSSVSVNPWGPQSWTNPGSLTINGQSVNTLQVNSMNPSYFVPLKADGTPFEFAPEHTYTVEISYQVTATASSSNGGKLLFCAGIPSDGSMNGANLCYTSVDSGNEIASWMAGNNYTYTATKEISTIGMSSDSNYNSNDNTYVKNYNGTDYTLYNYLYFIIPDYVKPTLDIISLKITRDDYVAYGTVEYIGEDGSVIKSETAQVGDYAVNFTPEVAAGDYFMGWYTDAQFTNEVTNCTVELTEAGIKLYSKWEYKGNWDTDLDKKYIFDLANMGYYSDIACKADGSGVQHDTTKPWVYGAISYNSGFGRGLRNVYPVQSIYSDKNWGPQAFLQPDTVQVDGKTVNSLKFTEINTGRFVPLKADGTPFELAPGHKYYISVKYYYRQDTSGTTLIEAYAGIPGEYYNETSYDSAKSTYGTVYTATRFEWLYDDEVGQVFETKNIVLDLTTLGDDENYDYDTNTYTVTYGDKEYTLYNYLNFGLTGGKSVVDFLELEIYRDDYTEVTDGQFNVGDVTNNTTYKVTFDYIVRNTIENNIGIGFKTTAADGIGYPTYIEGKDVAIYNIKTDAATSKQHTATTFITTDMYATVDAKYGDDDLIAANSKLFGYVIGSDENVSIFNIKVEKVTDSSGNNVVNVGGAQCLIESAEATVGSQALRFTFNYDTMTGNELYINGIAYTVKERGFIYLDGNNYALNGIYSGNINLANAKAGVFVFDSKTDNFSRCWTATQIGDTELYNIGFSTYIKKFLIDDTREMMVRGFVVIEVDGQLLTIYSNTISRSVEYVKNGGGANYDPTVRRQVWGYDFSEISSLTDVADFHQNNNRNNFSANEYRNPVVGGDNYVLEDGVLKLKITYSDTETTGSVYDMPITLSTKDKMSYKYGYLELEAELPFERGIHQGFWLAPQNEFIGSGSYEKINDEIDIFEVDGIYNADQPKYSSILTNNGVVAFNLHKWYHYYDESGNQMTSTVNIGSLRYSDVLTITKDLFDEFTVTDKPSTDDSKYVFSDLTEARKLHRYGFEWTEEYVAVYIDPVVVNGTPVSEPYFKVNISGDNDFYNAAEGHENTVGMDCFHEEQYIILSFCPILSNTYAYGNEYNNATVHDIIDLAKERQGGESLEFKIHSIKLYQKAGESINFH